MNADTVDSLPGQVVTLMNQTSDAVLVNVTGKGALQYALCGYLNSNGLFKIEIDGQTFYMKNTLTRAAACGFFSKDSTFVIEGFSGTSSGVRMYLPSTNVSIDIDLSYFRSSTTYVPISELSQEVFSVNENACKTGFIFTKKPLRFEKSLKITLNGTMNISYSTGYNYIKYTLDD